MHARFFPKAHRFVYRVFMLSVDLDELAEIDRKHRLLSIDGRNLFSLRTNDFLPLTEPLHNPAPPEKCHQYGYTLQDRPSLKERVLSYLSANGIQTNEEDTRVELVTLPRMLGYRFNPVSFYFVRDAAGEPIANIVEVTNTFHEMKPFLLSASDRVNDGFRRRVPKNFYVSPFSDVDVEFDFKLRPLGERLTVNIDDYEGDRRNLATAITGAARPLSDGTLAKFLFTYPLLTLRVIYLIHWHALRLWLKRVPWFAKKNRAEEQSNLYRPHESLSERTESTATAAPVHQS
ncbi:MAG: DUF1365 domain-containing protein [Synoicihabitans sp.]